MASVTKTTNEILWRPAIVLVGTADAVAAADELGITRAATELSFSREEKEFDSQEFIGDLYRRLTKLAVSVKGSFAQFNKTTASYALGLAASGGKITFGGGYQAGIEEVACRVISATKAGYPVHVFMPGAQFGGDLALAMGKEDATDLPFEIKWNDGPSRAGYVLFGSTPETVTLATGSGARTQADPGNYISHLKISGEGAAADALTDITAATGSLADGEIVRLQITSASMPITITHGSGTLETKDSANWIMTKTQDWIDLIYNLSGTKWVELARHDE